MTHSDWGDWLPRAIEAATPAGVAIWYLGCNGCVLKGSAGTTLFIDPYLGTGDPPRTVRMIPVPFSPGAITAADAVLATHEHSDHVHGPTQAPILERTQAPFYGSEASLAIAREENWQATYDIDDEQFVAVSDGETFEIGEFTIHVEAAADPDAVGPVSYVIEHEAGTVLHPGDARANEVFEDIGANYDLDVGMLAFGTVGNLRDESGERTRTRWYNDENDLIEAANQLELDRVVPTHWDMWKGMTVDPTTLHYHAAGFPYPRRLELIEIGDRLDLPATR